ncbi:phage holin family protein [Oscillatoria sp. CS-180]|uniref:phage holin family protein n=1 Tax=Oscillatoria sp. CS-180 TaxID=3021720 RepID=UPI00232F70BF|nr:phage holin family protein [Oscillatoria sp. CS-180]MDB9527275.1 phage holin family protein [Oscillatoria sp. CS-180]
MIIAFLITVVVLAVSLWIVSLLPTGVEVDSPAKALMGGAVIGILNGLYHFLPQGLRSFGAIISLGLVPLIISIVVFGLSAMLIEGFRLRWGIMSAIIGAIALSIINSILVFILQAVGLL